MEEQQTKLRLANLRASTEASGPYGLCCFDQSTALKLIALAETATAFADLATVTCYEEGMPWMELLSHKEEWNAMLKALEAFA